MKNLILITVLLFAVTFLSCNPGARYFRMRKSRGETFPVEKINMDNLTKFEK